jgi:hypothetical protein
MATRAGEPISDSDYRYIAEYDFQKPHNTIVVEGFEVPVVLPKMPKKKYIKNYGKKKKHQKFRKEVIPKNLKRWEQKRKDRFVDKMYHKRKHGEWWYINGEAVYIPGKFWMYLNFWWTQSGKHPDFRSGDLDFFLVWEHCINDPKCYGLIDIKGRRMGDTEKAVFLMWEIASSTRNSWCGMQNVKEEFAKANFLRVVKGHNKMPWFFKPIMRGSSNPTKEMVFNYPEEIYSRKKLVDARHKGDNDGEQGELIHRYPAIDARIDYETTTKGAYDGVRLNLWHLDEPGKILGMNVSEQWEIIKPALALFNGETIVGKALWTTTVENFETSGKINTMEVVKKLWDESDPSNLNKNGQTKSGLYRYFRSCVNSYKTDEFGYHKRDECIVHRANNIESYTKESDWDGLANFLRKFPLTIGDVFTPPHKDCVLYPVLLDKRRAQIEENKAGNYGDVNPDGSRVTPKAVRGDFVWSNGFGSNVNWLPNPKGRWYVSQHPAVKNKRVYKHGKLPHPGNSAFFTFGVDPADHMEHEGKGSDMGGAIYRRFDRGVDSELDIDAHGVVCEYDVWKMQTGQFVADYLHRTPDPTGSYEDLLMAAIYFGVPIFPEKNKPAIILWFYSKGFQHYVQYRPKQTRVESVGKKKYRKSQSEKGITATGPVIDLYVQQMKKHVYQYIFACHHLRMIRDFRLFNVKNRSKRDLSVAAGMALLADMDQRTPKELESDVDKEEWALGMPTQEIRHNF